MKKKPEEGFIRRKKIKTLRKEKGLSRLQFSTATDVDYMVIWKLEEEAQRDCHVSTLARIADGLGVTVSDLINPAELWSKPSY